jgi:hypothetical protein
MHWDLTTPAFWQFLATLVFIWAGGVALAAMRQGSTRSRRGSWTCNVRRNGGAFTLAFEFAVHPHDREIVLFLGLGLVCFSACYEWPRRHAVAPIRHSNR